MPPDSDNTGQQDRITNSAATNLPFYITILEPLTPAGAWGYRCDACPSTWRNFTDAKTADAFAALHVGVHHDGC